MRRSPGGQVNRGLFSQAPVICFFFLPFSLTAAFQTPPPNLHEDWEGHRAQKGLRYGRWHQKGRKHRNDPPCININAFCSSKYLWCTIQPIMLVALRSWYDHWLWISALASKWDLEIPMLGYQHGVRYMDCTLLAFIRLKYSLEVEIEWEKEEVAVMRRWIWRIPEDNLSRGSLRHLFLVNPINSQFYIGYIIVVIDIITRLDFYVERFVTAVLQFLRNCPTAKLCLDTQTAWNESLQRT